MHHTGMTPCITQVYTMHHTGMTPCITQICGFQETHARQGQLPGFAVAYDIYYETP